MKTVPRLQPVRWWQAGFVTALLTAASATAQLQLPVITAIRQDRTNLIVRVQVPPGVQRVTLEGRDRLGARSWEPRAVARPDGAGGSVSFQLAPSRPLEVLRVRADAAEPLPAAFFTGTNQFLGQPSSPNGAALFDAPTGTRNDTAAGGEAAREVVESDIWKIRGTTLYFFNQYRGLQVIDIADPDAAVVRGTLPLPAAGEDMYLVGASYAVLLARGGCSSGDSQVLVVEVASPTPTVVAALPLPGTIQESRLVGTALYVASQTYRPVAGTTNTAWEWGTLVSAFDLADPAAPVARNTLWYAGYGNVVTATDEYLFVVNQHPTNWWQSKVRVVDITDPAGTMNRYGSVTTAGRVLDKFKLDYTGTVLTTISEDWHWDGGTRLVTKLETWRLPDPRSASPAGILKLGELELGQGESLRATRFDGDRVYVVTFFRIDPLWVVDLSDPVHPRVAGSVDVPGWSTYIEPWGDRLVSLGVETNRVAVSLFDVADPAAPSLLSRVLLGENWSWSEANQTEKAFTVLPEAGLVLVPFNGDISNRYTAALQLIDLGRRALTARGQIQSTFQFRRATAYADRILSISGWELLSVDAADRDRPVVSGRLELAWSVDRVFLQGDYLVELNAGNGWGDPGAPTLRVALATAPADVLMRLTLTNLPVLGATARGGRLYVAQGNAGGYYLLPLDAASGSMESKPTPFSLTVISLERLPAIEVLGATQAQTQPLGWSRDWQAVWPQPDVLVWVGGQEFWWWRCFDCALPLADGLGMPRIWPPYGGGTGGRLLAFDVGHPAQPEFASEISLLISNAWSFGKAFAADGLVFLSHQAVEFIPGLVSPWQMTAPTLAVDPASGDTIPGSGRLGTWTQTAYLDVVDYADPRDPLVRQPVNIPGTLVGLAHRGSLLYTTGPHWTTNASTAWNEYLDASAYDGVSAHLIDSLPLPTTWPHPVLAEGATVFLGWAGEASMTTNRTPGSVQSWTLSAAGRFTRLDTLTVPNPASVLKGFPGLLVLQETDATVDLVDVTDPSALRLIRRVSPESCWWFDLEHAAAEASRGVWIPLGPYGVATIPVKP